MTTVESELTEEDIDRMMLESYGIDGDFVSDGILNESVNRKPRLFGVDGFLVFGLDDAVDCIFRNEVFNAVLEEFHHAADDEGAYALVAEWSPDFLRKFVRECMVDLTKGEVLRYDELLRGLCGKYGDDGLISTVKSDDKRFGKMPNVVRIQ